MTTIEIEDSLAPDVFHVIYVDPTGARRVMSSPDELSALASLLGAHFDLEDIAWACVEAHRVHQELSDDSP